MKRVLMIAADFTPSSLPPALRIRFFAQHLREFGWEPVIVSVRPEFYETRVDAENERLLQSNLEIIRTKAFTPRWTRKLGIGDLGIRAFWHQWREVSRLCRAGQIDLVFVSVSPYISMGLARLANLRFGVPYVIDYIDPWVTDYYWKLPKNQRPPKWLFADRLARTVEPFSLREVAHLTAVSKRTTDDIVARYAWLADCPTTEIPYGGERADVEYVRRHRRSNPIFQSNDGCVHVTYAGTFNPGVAPVAQAVFAAIRDGLIDDPTVFGRLRLHFVGTSYARESDVEHEVLPLVREFGLEELASERPARLDYLTALSVICDSHALLVLGNEQPHYTASKIFPYIMAERPLLAVFHEESSVVRILRETGGRQIETFSESQRPQTTATAIRDWFRRLLTNPADLQPKTDWSAFERYTTRAMTARLAEAFNQALTRTEHRVVRTGAAAS
jgi:hypothetical protein